MEEALHNGYVALGISVLCNLIASTIFIFLLLKLGRPKFSISKYICSRVIQDGTTRYNFKIVNNSIFHAFDAHIELRLMEPRLHVGNHSNLYITSLPFKCANTKHIPRYRKKHEEKDPFALYAILIHTDQDLFALLNSPNSFLELKVTVRHGLTGLADTFVGTFSLQDCIKNGCKFDFGKKLDAIPYNKTV